MVKDDLISKTLSDLFVPNPDLLINTPIIRNAKTGELSKISLLFLDVDGVLNGHYSQIVYKTLPFPDSGNSVDGYVIDAHATDITAAKLINQVCEVTGALIVISSAWRVGFDMETLRTMMGTLGINKDLIIGKTDTMHTGDKARGEQIDRFLKGIVTKEGRDTLYKHGHLGEWVKFEDQVTVSTYAIVDDDGDMLESQLGNFVQTTFMDGLCCSHAIELGKILSNDETFYLERLGGGPKRGPLW